MDDISLGTLFGILLVLLLCSAFFSGSETSMMAINRYRLNTLVRKGNRSAKLVNKLLGKVDKLLGSILLGNTLVNVAAAAVTNIIILRLFGQDDLPILLGTLAITFALLVFSEIMPKIIAASHPERIALPSSYLLAPLITLFHPVVSVATALVKGILRLLRIRIETDQSKQKMTLEELRGLVLDAEHFLPRKHQKMLLNLVDLERITVNDVMIPRNQIEALDIDSSDLRQQIITCHHTLLPVYAETPSNIIGILHIKRAPALICRKTLLIWCIYARYCMNPISSLPTHRCSSNCNSFRNVILAWGWWSMNMVNCSVWLLWKTSLKKSSVSSPPNPHRNPANFCATRTAVSCWKAAAACAN